MPLLGRELRVAALFALFVGLFPACRAQTRRGEEDLGLGLPRAATVQLPNDWATSSATAFEAWVLGAFPEDQVTPIDSRDVTRLQQALEAPLAPLDTGAIDSRSVRAAVILGRSRYPSSASPLIRRLEARKLGPERHSDCGDVIAAAALARFPNPARYAQRLVPLAIGPHPHPDLEVRVECAATALHAGFPQVIPFLLQVLRIDTYVGQSERRDFAISATTAWARGRAAESLSTHAGVPLTYRYDGSIAHREEEAARLEHRLVGAPTTPNTD